LLPSPQLLLLQKLCVQLLDCEGKLKSVVDVFIGLEEDADGEGRKGFGESLHKKGSTLKKNSVETCSNIVDNNSLMISCRNSRIDSGM